MRNSIRLDKVPRAPISPHKVELSPQEWSRRIKDYAKGLGVDQVGIIRLRPERIFEGDEVKEPWVIALATHMKYELVAEMMERKFRRGAKEVLDVY